jgi:biotin carboxylase
MNENAGRRKRLLLLLSPNSYRAGAFHDAARKLAVDVVKGIDVPRGLEEVWDLPLAVDFSDLAGATEAIVRYAETQPIDAVVAVDDSATMLAERAAAALGLPHNPLEAAEAARDKGIMRRLMSQAGVPCPVFRALPLAEHPRAAAQEVTYPCVVKPLRMNGSRGVMRADDPDELVAAFLRLRQLHQSDGYPLETTSILVEGFIPGGEVALEGLLTAGTLHTLALFDKPDPLDGPYFEETIYVTPSRLPAATQRDIVAVAAHAAAAIGLRDGPVHAELRVNEQGPWMLEIAGRSIGGLCSTILQFGTDMCLEELILRHALGFAVPSYDRAGAAAGVMMIPIPKAGILRAVQGVPAAEAVPHITGVEITAKLNYSLVPLPEGNSYLGFIFARAEDPATAEEALRRAHSLLHFDIRATLPVLSAAQA